MNTKTWITSFVALILAPGILSIAAVRASAAGTGGAAAAPRATATHESPFACDIMALDTAARKRHFDVLGPKLRSLRQAVNELPDGYEFRFAGDPKTVDMLVEWAAGERLCCPFFDIEVRMDREGGPLWLKVTGRKGTKEFIQTDGAAWIKQ